MNKQRTELHLHTTMSAMDGVSTIKDYINAAICEKMPAIAITDHASVQAFPEAYSIMKRCSDLDFRPKLIYGNEVYMVDDRPKAVIGISDEGLNGEFTVVDIETTGLDPNKDKITEIAAYKIKNGVIVDSFTTLVNPEVEISEEISNLTGITNEMVKNAPTIKSALKNFVEFYNDSIIVAHNAKFDISFLKSASKEYNIDFVPTYIDTLTIAKSLLPESRSYKLATICEELKIEHASQHRAFGDAKATAEMFLAFCEKLKAIGVDAVEKINEVMTGSKRGRREHATILVLNKSGLKNLYKLVSIANTENFYKVPITLKSDLKEFREGLLIGSGCDCGELYGAVRDGLSNDELVSIAEFYDYLEVVPTENFEYYIESGYAKDRKDLVAINKKIIEIGEITGKPVVAVSDAHYVRKDDVICRKIIMNHQGYDDYKNQPNLSMKTTEEMFDEFSYLNKEKAYEIVVDNPNRIAAMVEDLFPPIDTDIHYDADIKELVDLTYEKLHEKYGERIPQESLDRIDVELSKIGQNPYSVYCMLLATKLAGRATEKGWTIGNRGSVSSSYVAYLLGVAQVNPMDAHYYCPNCHYVEFHSEYNCGPDMKDKLCSCGTKLEKDGFTIPHETFLGINGLRDIDIDFNFSPEYQNEAMKHLEELTEGNVIRCGTIGTIAYKTACAMIDKYCEKESIEVDEFEREDLAEKISRVKMVTGMHPGGMYIVPKGKEVHDYTPVQHPANRSETGTITTHFDYYSLIDLLKVDVLAHDMHAMIKQLEELTKVNSKDIPLDDPETFSLFNNIKTKGIPEFSHPFVRNSIMPIVGELTMDKLIRVSGLSHGTGVWEENGENLINDGKDLADVVSCRDDVMLHLVARNIERNVAYSFSERIRKGKGLTEEHYEGLIGSGIEQWRLDSWNKIKYSFPRAHAASYTLYAYKIAYYKAHFPLEFYCAYFSTYADEFDADLLVNNTLSLKDKMYKLYKQEPTWNTHRKLEMMEVCLEMYERGYTFVSDNIKKERFVSFFIEDGKLRPRIK